jgi:hypothetical protein
VDPPYLWRLWFHQTLFCIMSKSFLVKLNFSCSMVLKHVKRKTLKRFSYIFTLLLWPHPTPRGHDFNKLDSVWCREASMLYCMSFSGSVMLSENIFKSFPVYINTCKNVFPYGGPIQLPGTMILKTLCQEAFR